MRDMPRPRPPHLHREVTRHGRAVWYVRIGRRPRVRIRADFGTPEFDAEYRAALAGEPPARKTRGAAGTLEWLIDRYRASAAWAALKPSTKRQRDNIFAGVVAKSGAAQFAGITRRTIVQARDDRAATPFAASNFLKAMRGLFAWAAEAEYVAIDPTKDVKISLPRTAGFHVWTEAEIAAFENRWPVGTRERLALALLLYTGLRRGDVVRLGRQHVGRDGWITIRTEKTGQVVTLPMLECLRSVIAASTTGDLTYIVTADGKQMVKEGFGNWFRDACNAAGVPGSAHGLRKAGATRAANNGASEAELEALFGWRRGSRQPARYTETANRARLAGGSAQKLERS